MMAPSTSSRHVIVVGAGPVGLLTALCLATADPPIPITVLEMLPEIESSPRAMAYQPVAVKELDRAGILADARKIGTFGTKICWRRPRQDGSEAVIATLERVVTKEHPYENLVIGQHELAALILERLEKCQDVRVEFNTKVVGIEDKDDSGDGKVKVITETDGGEKESVRGGLGGWCRWREEFCTEDMWDRVRRIYLAAAVGEYECVLSVR